MQSCFCFPRILHYQCLSSPVMLYISFVASAKWVVLKIAQPSSAREIKLLDFVRALLAWSTVYCQTLPNFQGSRSANSVCTRCCSILMALDAKKRPRSDSQATELKRNSKVCPFYCTPQNFVMLKIFSASTRRQRRRIQHGRSLAR